MLTSLISFIKKAMKNILIIDDDQIIQKVLSKVLLQKGYVVESGSDGGVGVAKLDLMQYDLIVTDIMMPHLNGFEFIDAIKKHPNAQNARLIVISSVTHEASIRDSIQLGVDLYLPKPITIQDFLTKIEELLQ